MKKIRVSPLLGCVILLMFLLAGCGSSRDGTVQVTVHEDVALGLTLELPTKELEDWTVLYGPFSQDVDRGEYAPEDGSSFFFKPMESGVTFFDIQYYPEATWDGWIQEGKTADEITGKTGSEEIGRNDGMIYIYCPYEPDDSAMDDATKAEYQRILDMLPAIKASIKLTNRPGVNINALPEFSTTDLSGNPVDSSIFAGNKLTMLNIWGTFCGPCIEEMPDLEAMSKNMPEGTAIVGLVTDALDESYIKLANDIVTETGVTYTNIIPDNALNDYVNENIVGIPTTIFIDSNGKIVGDALVGAKSADVYMQELISRLEGLGDIGADVQAPEDSEPQDSSPADSSGEFETQDSSPADSSKELEAQDSSPADASGELETQGSSSIDASGELVIQDYMAMYDSIENFTAFTNKRTDYTEAQKAEIIAAMTRRMEITNLLNAEYNKLLTAEEMEAYLLAPDGEAVTPGQVPLSDAYVSAINKINGAKNSDTEIARLSSEMDLLDSGILGEFIKIAQREKSKLLGF